MAEQKLGRLPVACNKLLSWNVILDQYFWTSQLSMAFMIENMWNTYLNCGQKYGYGFKYVIIIYNYAIILSTFK